ncbi:MAG: ATP-binding cassette domain-containing protein [Faecalibacillus sp.]
MVLEVHIFKKLKEFDLNVDLTVDKECLGLMGNSGGGKSMTLKCIAGIEIPDSGYIKLDDKVLFDSKNNINLSPQERNIGYLFQSYALFDHMDVYHNIECGLKAHQIKNRKQIINQMLSLFHIEELEKRYPHQLSGGQKQRVALARVLAYSPDVLLLDEPLSALDEELKKNLKKELLSILRHYQKPVIFVSHNQDEINQICQRQVKIKKGEIQ